MSQIAQLAGDFRASIQQSLQIAEFIERGQAHTPFVELFQQLERGSRNKPLGITLLALTDEARSAALKWLYGHHFAVVSLEISRQIGLFEVHLRDQGYFLEKSTGERLEFADWDSFHQAVSDADLIKNTDKAGLKIGTETATKVRDLQVLMPESSEFVAESPALLTKLVTESNLLMVAAPPDYQMTANDTQVLNQLLEDMCAFWPLLPVDELAGDAEFPEHGWWDKHKSLISLAPTLLTTHIDAAIPPQLAEVDDELRSALQLALAVKKHVNASDALADRYAQEMRRLQSRKKREERKSGSQQQPAQSDSALWSQLRTELNDDFTQQGKQLQEINRKRELPNSTGNVSLKQYLDGLGQADLDREPGYKTIKLSLSEEYSKNLTQFMQNTSRAALKEDIAAIQQQVRSLAERLCDKCYKQLGYKPKLPITALDESGLWQDVKEVIALELRYQGEIPKRGFVDRLSEGRKGAMMLLMSVMLLGYIGVDLRSSGWFGFILLPMFLGAIFYTYISFRKDEQHRLEKELIRVRDELLNNSRRVVTDILRLKQTKLTEYLDQTKKQWQQHLDQVARDHQARQQSEREQTSITARARISAIDKQLIEWQRYQQPVQKLVADVQRLNDKTRRELATLQA